MSTKKALFIFLIVSFVVGSLCSTGWSQEWPKESPWKDLYNVMDLVIARPLGIIAAAVGTGVVVVSMPFTLPTRSVGETANMLIVKPWKFSFVREYPDDALWGWY
jgi:hypothetical protein